MAPFTFALLATLTALVSASPITLDIATLALNGQKALVQNCQFQALQQSDTCNRWPGDLCQQHVAAVVVPIDKIVLRSSASTSKWHLLLNPSNGQFIACTSLNNAASIIAATGIQTNIANNCTSPATAAPISPSTTPLLEMVETTT
ncbi:hypothetical protein BC826DRAFT_1144053 [Russula brevipes]|nr:hypothetical protein BC826DRAFT_1144053 [Russula brevipes]